MTRLLQFLLIKVDTRGVQSVKCTHGDKMIPIPAMVYFINDPDSQRSGCDMGGPTTLKVGEALYKICPFTSAQFLKKKSRPICPVECLKFS